MDRPRLRPIVQLERLGCRESDQPWQVGEMPCRRYRRADRQWPSHMRIWRARAGGDDDRIGQWEMLCRDARQAPRDWPIALTDGQALEQCKGARNPCAQRRWLECQLRRRPIGLHEWLLRL